MNSRKNKNRIKKIIILIAVLTMIFSAIIPAFLI